MLGQDRDIRRAPFDPSPTTAYSPTYSSTYSHSRTRTKSSNIFPAYPMHLQQPQPPMGHNRRSPSVNTFNSVSSNTPPAAFRTSPTTDVPRRSTSSRSGGGGQAASYVALLRKQKATVWCDRSQTEDPRMLAQQRAAKQRATQEVVGRASQSRSSTGIGGAGKVAAKIRHHGKPGVVGYSPDNNYMGVGGVPLRLSATEVEGEDSDDDDLSMQRSHHRRTGSSGRSSTASGRRGLAYRNSGGGHSHSGKKWSPGDTPERGSLVMEDPEFRPGDDKIERPQSTRSGSSAEKADALPELTGPNSSKLASNSLMNAALTREKSVKNPEDLRRRGSVDERTATLTSGRLFIANPD